MTFIDFFSGIGGMRSGLERAGHKCLGFCEFDKFARQSYKAMYDTEGGWENHDIRTVNSTDIPRADIWCFGFPCFVAGTLIKTNVGFKNIEEIKVGDYVLTHRGRYRQVVQTMSQTANVLYHINAMGVASLSTTENHPFLVKERYFTWNNSKRMYERCFTDAKWVEAKNLTRSSFLSIPVNQENVALNNVELPINDDRFYRFVGRWIGDGWISRGVQGLKRRNQVLLCCGKKDVETVKEELGDLFPYKITEMRTVYKFSFRSRALYDFLDTFGTGAAGKVIPQEILNLPIEKLKLVLDGYFSADGCIVKKMIKATTVSEKLAYGIAMCIHKVFKRPCAIYLVKVAPEKQIENRVVKQKNWYQIVFKVSNDKQDTAFYENGYIYTPVRAVKKEYRECLVYNIGVEEDESYTANTVGVHNCQDISVAGKQKGLQEGERSGLFYEVMRLLAGLREEDKPEWLIAENVKNLLSIGNGFDFLRCLTEMGQVGYDVEWQLFNTKFGYYSYDTYIPGIPQNRERVYLIGHLGSRGGQKILPIPRTAAENNSQKSGFKIIDDQGRLTKECTPKSECPTLRSEVHGNVPKVIDDLYDDREPRVTDDAPTLRSERSGLKVAIPCLTPDRLEKRQNGRRFKEDGEEMFTLTAQDRHGVAIYDVYNHKFKNGEETGTLTAAGNSNTTAAGTMLIVENTGNNYE